MGIPKIIAIDGPAASGKSTLGYKLAQALGYLYFDTGVMYRAVTWLALKRGVDIYDESAITVLTTDSMSALRLSRMAGRRCLYRWTGHHLGYHNLKWTARLACIIMLVRKPIAQQRRIGLRGMWSGWRDIGTAVLPKADLEFTWMRR
jgi:cytidylate kinase